MDQKLPGAYFEYGFAITGKRRCQYFYKIKKWHPNDAMTILDLSLTGFVAT